MPSRCRPNRRDRALIVAASLLIGGCSSVSSRSTSDIGHVHTAAADHPDRPITGAQGRVAQFVVECAYSHMASDDPIVAPGHPGESHLHVFFGNVSTDAASTLDTLRAAPTTCDQPLDRASYWAPALYLEDQPLTPVKSTAYYRPGEGVDPTTVRAYPPGLKMVAGNADARQPQSTAVVAWTCGTGIDRDVMPPHCPTGRNLRLIVTFPDCWDGVHTDSPDHVSHVAYSSGGQCSSRFPVPVPQLQFSVEYPVSGTTGLLALASGGLITGHADFFNAWDEAKLQREISVCLHRKLVCGVTSGRTAG
jgi:hypothetical protein